MDNEYWRPTPAAIDGDAAGGGGSGGDWRTQLPPELRERVVRNIAEILKRHLPVSGPEGLQELKKTAVRLEEEIYTAATSQADYLRKISLKMLTMEMIYPNTNTLPSNSAGNTSKRPDSVSLDSSAQTSHVDGGDWKEEIYQKIKSMKEAYLPELNEMHEKILLKLQQPSFREKLVHYERQIINFINTSTPKKPLQPGPLPSHMHPMQPQQTLPQINQVQSHENQMITQLQALNLQGSATMQQNNLNNLQHSSMSSMPGVSNAPQSMLNSVQTNSSMDSGQVSALSSLQRMAMTSMQQNSVTVPQQLNLSTMPQQSGVNMLQSNVNTLQSNSNMLQLHHLKQQQEQQMLQTQQLKQQFQQQQMQLQLLWQLLQQQQQQQQGQMPPHDSGEDHAPVEELLEGGESEYTSNEDFAEHMDIPPGEDYVLIEATKDMFQGLDLSGSYRP